MKKAIITLCGAMLLAQPVLADFKEHYDLGQENLSNYQYSGAITEFKNALRINYLDNSARLGLVNSYLSRGAYYANKEKDYEKAADDFRSALFYIKYYPTGDAAKHSASFITPVQSNLSKCLEAMGYDYSAASRFNKAKQLRAEGNFSAAGYEFNQALGDKAYIKDCYTQVGDIMKLLGNDPKAVEYYRKAISVAPNDISLRLSYAKLLDKLGQENAAVEEYNYILSKTNNNQDIFYSLERIYKKKLEQSPSDSDIISNLGAILQKQGKLDEALMYYKKAEQLDPSNINTRINVGTLYQQKGDYKTALIAYDSVLIVQPDNINANLFKAQCQELLGNNKEAQQLYKKVLSLDPSNETVLTQIFDNAKKNMTTPQFIDYVKKNSNGADVTDMLYSHALDLHKNQKLVDAIIIYKELLPKDTTGEIYTNLAIAQSEMNDYKSALATLDTAKAKFPNNSDIKNTINSINDTIISNHFDSASKYFNNKDYQKAVEEYLKIQPPTADSMLGVASAYQNMGDMKNAINYYKKALELKPTDSDIAYYIGALYSDLENYKDAETYLNKALLLNKNNQNAKDLLSSIKEQNAGIQLDNAIKLYDDGKYDESLALLNPLLATDSNNAYALYYRGMIYDAKQKFQEAISDFKKVLSLNSTDFGILNYFIASDYDNLGKLKEAREYYLTYASSDAPEDEYKTYAKARAEELKDAK